MLYTASLAPGHSAPYPQTRRPRSGRASAISKVRSTNEVLRLVRDLRAQGATVEVTNNRVPQPFFSVAARIINVNGQGVQIFEYAQVSKAGSEAKRVSSNGMTIGKTRPLWLSTPHFFKKKKLIVLYVGDDQTILRILVSTLGNQFAGG